MQDPKYRFGYSDHVFHRDYNYVVPSDEPLMLLRGKDVTSLAAIIGYIDALYHMQPTETVRQHILSSVERLREFYRYQVNNAEKAGVKCSQLWHDTSDKILERAGAWIDFIDAGGLDRMFVESDNE